MLLIEFFEVTFMALIKCRRPWGSFHLLCVYACLMRLYKLDALHISQMLTVTMRYTHETPQTSHAAPCTSTSMSAIEIHGAVQMFSFFLVHVLMC